MILQSINQDEFNLYLEQTIEKYGNEIAKTGVSQEQALEQSKQQIAALLPDGMQTTGSFFYNAYDNNIKVGFIWYGIRSETTAFIYDFFIFDKYHRQGYGTKVMLACEQDIKSKGLTTIELHVFGHNVAARKLYEKLNYYPTSIRMKKDLS